MMEKRVVGVTDGVSEYKNGILGDKELKAIHAYWSAGNYLSVGQIYLMDNPLLLEPLKPEHIKPRLLGHWGTTPGLNLIYTHLNRVIIKYDLDMIFVCGPGHGGPAMVSNTYLEGSYSDHYATVSRDKDGMRKLFKQFSFPGGIPSHTAAEVPGSIHEGGELGYSVSHAYGAAFDNPDLLVVCVVGDGEAETGPLATSWHSNKFLNPARDGTVLPILHLNGYKIANPAVLARIPDAELDALFYGYGYKTYWVEGNDPVHVHQCMAATLEVVVKEIREIQRQSREAANNNTRPQWPMIILKTPKGWTGPKEVDGKISTRPMFAVFNRHRQGKKLKTPGGHTKFPFRKFVQTPNISCCLRQVSFSGRIIAILNCTPPAPQEWLKSYHPEDLFDSNGTLLSSLQALAPKGARRMGSNPHANGGKLSFDLRLPDFRDYSFPVPHPGTTEAEATRIAAGFLRDTMQLNAAHSNMRIFGPDETASNRLSALFEVTDCAWMANRLDVDENLSRTGRVMEMLSEHTLEGWLEGYLLTGRHGLFSCYEAFIHLVDSMFNQHAKWLKVSKKIPWRRPIPSLNYLLTSHVWRQDHNGFSHQDPGFIDHVVNKKAEVIRIYLPPDANCLLTTVDHCLRSKHYVNLIIAGKQPSLQFLDMDNAVRHCTKGLGIWDWASNDQGTEPDLVMASCGDVPTLEALAATEILRSNFPEIRIRFVNVVDLMALQPQIEHPHGLADKDFDLLFTTDKPIVFVFHGYPWLIHRLTYRRKNHPNLHVRGYKEEGTTTTPFDMAVLNQIDRYTLASDAIVRLPQLKNSAYVYEMLKSKLIDHKNYIIKNGQDLPEFPRLTMCTPILGGPRIMGLIAFTD
ncbi:phosphoketolase family protein [Pelomyxa schiedti]|nr:phosphoketolase family protein [Pelomyxa schiedti]